MMDDQKESKYSMVSRVDLQALVDLAGSVECTACGYTLAEHPVCVPEIACAGRSPGGTEDWTEEIQLIKSFEGLVNIMEKTLAEKIADLVAEYGWQNFMDAVAKLCISVVETKQKERA